MRKRQTFFNMSDPNLVTTYSFNNRDFFIKMHVTNNNLELVITDKQTGEDWQCCYDASYIENITQKTGNFKQFHIFTAMLKSGLLKTSSSVYLDFMTFDDLDALRNHRIRGPYSIYHSNQSSNNRRYLILTYTVEFDRIHYPLPLEYCGPPDPKILQQNIVKLEQEVVQLKEQLKGGNVHRNDSKLMLSMQKKVDDLADENVGLRNEITKLTNMLERKSNYQNYIIMLQSAIKNLEQSVLSERKSHHKLVEKLRKDKLILSKELDRVRHSEKELLSKLQNKKITRIFSRHHHKNYKRTSDPGVKSESRSPSPRLIKSESWETHVPPSPTKPKRLTRSPRVKRRSKSSSGSESDREYTQTLKFPSLNPSNTVQQNKKHSRPESSSSRSSSGSKTYHHNIAANIKSPLDSAAASKSSELDFSNLENRILALQKMLQKGMHIT